MYLNPKDLTNLINEILRIVNIGFLFCEQVSEPALYEDHWLHDYKSIFHEKENIKSVNYIKIESDIWPGKWSKKGYLIKVEKLM